MSRLLSRIYFRQTTRLYQNRKSSVLVGSLDDKIIAANPSNSSETNYRTLNPNMAHNAQILNADEHKFPVDGLLPKAVTQAASFIQTNPTFDGRGTIIAVLDTGVDPGAPGLQVTTTGLPKIVDIVDSTGSGDVCMNQSAVPENGLVTGLTKRKLKIPESWPKAKDGKYFVGTKELGELIPPSAKGRYAKDSSGEHLSKLQEISAKLMETNPKPTEAGEKSETPSLSKLMTEKNNEHLHEGLKSVISSIVVAPQDSKWMVDCICFKSESDDQWYGAVDLSEIGDLSKTKLMRDYKTAQEWHTFDAPSHQNYSFKFYENEPLLDIKSNGLIMCVVTAGGSHGTHVSGIACANFPEDPERNGVAPGAQLVAVKIGDTRLSTTETNIGLIRGIKAAADNGADLINYSYGESVKDLAKNENASIVSQTLKQFANKHGGLFVTSAGNSGPGLSSIGAPACLLPQFTMGVGAQVFPNMMDACYSMLEKHPANQFSWSSRGPTYNGALGVSISAPGGAITSVPNYTLQKQMLMNGTSMSSPNACGCTSLILSAAKQSKTPYSIFSLKRAIENSAKVVDNVEPWAQGQGLIQVGSAFEHLSKFSSEKEVQALFDIDVSTAGGLPTGKGVYMREACETTGKQIFGVTVHVDFDERISAAEKIDYTCDCAIVCNEAWVSTPKVHELQNDGGSRSVPFRLEVDPSLLPEEGEFYTEVQGFDLSNTDKGPIFRVPITVLKSKTIQPSNVQTPKYTNEHTVSRMKSGQINRRYIQVPAAATNCRFTLKNLADCDQKIFMTTTQLLPGTVFDNCDGRDLFVGLEAGQEKSFNIPTVPNTTMEFAISRYWAAVGGPTDFSYSMDFSGIQRVQEFNERAWLSDDTNECFHGVYALAVQSLTRQNLASSAELTHATYSIRPKTDKSVSGALGPRDAAIDFEKNPGMFQQVLTYELKPSANSEIQIFSPTLHSMLYENSWYRQHLSVYDSQNRLVHTVDLFGNQAGRNKFFKVKKDETYTIRFQISHKDQGFLESYQTSQLLVKQKLEKKMDLKVTRELHSVFDNKSVAHGSSTINSCDPGRTFPFYVVPPSDEQLKNVSSLPIGSCLSGKLSFSHGKVHGNTAFPIKFYVMDHAPKVEAPAAKKPKKADNTIDDDTRDAKLDWLKKHPTKSQYKETRDAYPEHLPVYEKVLGALWEKCDKGVDVSFLELVCDDIINKFNIHQVISEAGLSDAHEDAGKKKTLLQDAYMGKFILEVKKNSSEEVLDNLYKNLLFFGKDILEMSTSSKHSLAIDVSKAQNGWKLKYLLKAHSNMSSKPGHGVHEFSLEDVDDKQVLKASKLGFEEIEKRIAELVGDLGWTYVKESMLKEIPARFPSQQRPF